LVPDFFPRDEFRRAAGEQGQNSERLRGQVEEDARLAQLTRFEVQLEDPEARSGVCRCPASHKLPAGDK
jgi:hypothetical protein